MECARSIFDNTSELPGKRGLLAAVLSNLGLAHLDVGDKANAMASLTAALDCAQSLSVQYPESEKVQEYLHIARSNLALVYVETERYAEALQYYEQVVSYRGPETPEIVAVKALSARQVARLWKRVGDAAKAETNFQTAVEMGQRLLDSNATPEQAYEMMLACCELGSHLAWMSRRDESRIAFQRGINTGERLLKDHPRPSYRASLAYLFSEAGSLEQRAFASETAQDFYLKAIELRERLREKSPADSENDAALVSLYINLGNCLKNGEMDKSLEPLGKAIDLGGGLVEQSPENLAYRESLMSAHLNRAITFDSLNRLEDSRDDYRAAIDVSSAVNDEAPAQSH